MDWVGITYGSRTELAFIDRDTLTNPRNFNELTEDFMTNELNMYEIYCDGESDSDACTWSHSILTWWNGSCYKQLLDVGVATHFNKKGFFDTIKQLLYIFVVIFFSVFN